MGDSPRAAPSPRPPPRLEADRPSIKVPTDERPIRPRRPCRRAFPGMSEDACWDHIRSHSLARLIYPPGHGPRTTIVNYAAVGSALVLHLPEFNEASHYLLGQRVGLEVIATDVDGTMWSLL